MSRTKTDTDENLLFIVEIVSHSSFPDYQLRLTQSSLCDATVKQRSGFLDISPSRSLFFWFFESRNDPGNAPLMLWLNGGPGCSSIASGLLFEHGPCFIADEGNSTIRNSHSWNEVVNIIYLDSPIGTGFSHSTDGSKVDTLADVAVDVYAFMQVFLNHFSEYSAAPFHIAGESWGGHYVPTVANYIFQRNKELIYAPRRGILKINLSSVILANGLTEPATQFDSIPHYACDPVAAPYPPLSPDRLQCRQLNISRPTCVRMIEACYKYQTKLVCNAATDFCWPSMMTVAPMVNKNPYDLRRSCDEDATVCYIELDWVTKYMNDPQVKKSLGAHEEQVFQTCNMDVNKGFYYQGQAMHNSAALLPELVNNGVRLLAYAGDTDMVCNFIGIERWMERLEHNFHKEFASSRSQLWTMKSGRAVGEFRSAGAGHKHAGNVTFVKIWDGGHMAPHDQPEAALDMITKWVKDSTFSGH
ncbi:serine carboxypeptidase [Abortiporus biennis]|nr:serine carboxypeptidase [Abortiporus biennis]